VAEQIVLNEISTGAQNDLERATAIVRQMIMEYGMSERLGPITLGKKQEQVFLGRDLARDRDYSEDIARSIDLEIRNIIDECYNKAVDILTANRDKLDLLANALLEQETLNAEEIAGLMEGKTFKEINLTADGEKEADESLQNGGVKGQEIFFKRDAVEVFVNEKKLPPENN